MITPSLSVLLLLANSDESPMELPRYGTDDQIVFDKVYEAYNIPVIPKQSKVVLESHEVKGIYTLFMVRGGVHFPIVTANVKTGKVIFDVLFDDPMDYYEQKLYKGLPFVDDSTDSIDHSIMGTPLTPALKIAASVANHLYGLDIDEDSIPHEEQSSFIHRLCEVYGADDNELHLQMGNFDSLVAVLYGTSDGSFHPISLYDPDTGKVWFDFYHHSPELFNIALDLYSLTSSYTDKPGVENVQIGLLPRVLQSFKSRFDRS